MVRNKPGFKSDSQSGGYVQKQFVSESEAVPLVESESLSSSGDETEVRC